MYLSFLNNYSFNWFFNFNIILVTSYLFYIYLLILLIWLLFIGFAAIFINLINSVLFWNYKFNILLFFSAFKLAFCGFAPKNHIFKNFGYFISIFCLCIFNNICKKQFFNSIFKLTLYGLVQKSHIFLINFIYYFSNILKTFFVNIFFKNINCIFLFLALLFIPTFHVCNNLPSIIIQFENYQSFIIYITDNKINLDILVLQEIENIFKYYANNSIFLLFNLQDYSFQIIYKYSNIKTLYYIYSVFWYADNYDLFVYYNGFFYAALQWDLVAFLALAQWAIFFSHIPLWKIFTFVGGGSSEVNMKVPAIVPHKPLTPPTLIQEDSTVLGPGNGINNSIVQPNPVEALPQTLLGPTDVVTTKAGEAQINKSPLEVLDNVSDILVDNVNSAELTGLAISNISTLVGEASLLSAVGIAGLAPLIAEWNESKSESKEAASTSLPKANQEENARLTNYRQPYIVDILSNRPNGRTQAELLTAISQITYGSDDYYTMNLIDSWHQKCQQRFFSGPSHPKTPTSLNNNTNLLPLNQLNDRITLLSEAQVILNSNTVKEAKIFYSNPYSELLDVDLVCLDCWTFTELKELELNINNK